MNMSFNLIAMMFMIFHECWIISAYVVLLFVVIVVGVVSFAAYQECCLFFGVWLFCLSLLAFSYNLLFHMNIDVIKY